MAMGFSPSQPGISTAFTSSEADIIWSGYGAAPNLFRSALIVSTAVDSGNTPTTALRPGLVMAELADGTGWVDYLATSLTAGRNQAKGVLLEEVNMLDPFAAASAARFWRMCVGGPIKGGNLIGADQKSRFQMKNSGFIFDDDLFGNPYAGWRTIVAKTTSYTVLATDQNTLFTTLGAGGAVTFTLPTIAAGLRFLFLNMVDQNMVITGAANSIVADGSITGTNITFSTGSHKLGSFAEVTAENVAAAGALQWVLTNRGATLATIS